jgi:non-ribosomal peptide synthetase component F
LTRQEFSLAKDFWLEFLKGFENPTRLDLFPPRSQTSEDSSGRGVNDCLLSREDTESLRAFATRHDVALGTLIQVSWSVLLARYSGQDDVLFGATRACRHSSIDGAESVVGLLMNTVPMRVRLPPDLLVLECLKRVRADWVAVRAYEHTSLGDIQAWSGFGPKRPLFENILVIEDHALGEDLQSRGGDWQRREFQLFERSDYPVAGAPTPDHASSCAWLTDTKPWTTTRRRECSAIGGAALMGVMTHAERRVADLPLLTDAEQALMHIGGNNPQRQLSAPSCLHELFEAQVTKTPAAAALRLEAETVTYDDLNARANRLARHLQDIGVGPESLVAICMVTLTRADRRHSGSLEERRRLPPHRPRLPKGTRSSRCSRTRAPRWYSPRASTCTLSHLEGLTAISVDTYDGEIARHSADNLRASASPDNLAYAMYTSGSTGAPKLVGVEHRAP